MSNTNNIYERRSSLSSLSAPSLVGEEKRTIEGLAIVYDEESEVMYDWWEGRSFREIVHQGAVTEELLRSSDVLALYEHDRKQLLARSTNGSGSLQLTITERGLQYSFEAPNTQLGNDTLELLRRGDLRGSSFLFGVKKGDTRWEELSDGTWLRHIDHFSYIGDVSVVSTPAYPATTASAERSKRALDEERGLPEPTEEPTPAPVQEETTPEEAPEPVARTPLAERALRWAGITKSNL